MNLTIIIPSLSNDTIVRKIKKASRKSDEVIKFKPKSNDYVQKINTLVYKAKNDNILLVNLKDYSLSLLLDSFRNEDIIGDNNNIENNKPSKNSSIKFNRVNTILPDNNDKIKNLSQLCTGISENNKTFKENRFSLEDQKEIIKEINSEKKKQKNEKDKILNEKKTRKLEKGKNKKLKSINLNKIDKEKGEKINPFFYEIEKENVNNQNIQNKDNIIVKKKQEIKKPKVLLITDVKKGAGWIKSQYLKKYLSDYYDIDITWIIGNRNAVDNNKYDVYFTFGYSYVKEIKRVNFYRRITGLTAHRPLTIIKNPMNMASAVHANSVLLYNELLNIHKNVFYTPNGVDTELFYPKNEILFDGEVIFGHVGKRSPRKRQKEIIEPAINKAGVKYKPHYNNYRSAIPHEKMVDVHNNYSVYICASEEDGTPCPALEAAACGRAIISNKIGNMPELITNYYNGILLDKPDVDLYVDAIKWCKDNPEKVKKMGENNRKEIVKKWDGSIMAKNYMRIIDNILQIERDPKEYENPALYHIKENY